MQIETRVTLNQLVHVLSKRFVLLRKLIDEDQSSWRGSTILQDLNSKTDWRGPIILQDLNRKSQGSEGGEGRKGGREEQEREERRKGRAGRQKKMLRRETKVTLI